ncbi:hypothetical protein F383_26842 [Gossypium arboreum]|uniref:Uncharacterized protein n=1 Tax=Gossypium arboreum TaxID=29729 RepID=A0A0B0PA83_GOSAR|nr:hypothetical protein F383_26842 [Gossypium arboreum]
MPWTYSHTRIELGSVVATFNHIWP